MPSRTIALLLVSIPSAIALAPTADAQTNWGFNLPTSTTVLSSEGYANGFESGTLSAELAVTAVDAATGLPDVDAWCQIGTGQFSAAPYAGSFDFEFGFDPNSAHGWHDVRNALVIGLDGTGHAGPFELVFRYYDFGESNQAVDGVWLSSDGVGWYQVTGVDGGGASGLGWDDWSDGLSQWGTLSFDLAAAASAHSLSLSGTFYVAIAEQTGFPLGFFGGILIDELTLDAASPWTDLGSALAGTHGEPSLAGDGTLAAGTPVTLSLGNALESAPTTLVIGFSELSAAFKGGVLVPQPDLLISGLVTDAGGQLVLGGTWPAGVPGGSSLWFQHWIVDAAGPVGFAASNGLRADTP
jgi:hypothetical protein